MVRLLPGVITALMLGVMVTTGPALAHCQQQGGSHSSATGSQGYR
ncbi:hypothetical protein [Cyanobium sp. CH-040]|nr:hypothetical protein [Cyanobium sp. CH-040]